MHLKAKLLSRKLFFKNNSSHIANYYQLRYADIFNCNFIQFLIFSILYQDIFISQTKFDCHKKLSFG
jgi:hypothetical protein